MLQRWHSSVAAASGTSVVITPAPTDNLYCYELADGTKRFHKSRDGAFYVAGIRDEQLLIVGARDVISFDMKKGRLNWRSDSTIVSPGQQIIGRGVFSPETFIFPTSANQLVEISLDDGTVVDRQSCNFPLGNLIAIDGEIISQSPTQLAVALGAKTLGPRVERMLKEDPDNLDALIQKARLLSEKGKRGEALQVLQRARSIDPESDDVLLLSISSMLGELRDNPSPPAGLEAELDALIDTPGQRLEFLALRIQSALRNKSVRDSTQRLLEFSSTLSELTPIGNESKSILGDPSRGCKLDGWIEGRAAEIVQLAQEQQQLDTVHELLDAFLEQKRTGPTSLLTALARQLRPLGIDSLVALIAGRHVAEGDLFAAERLMIGPRLPSQFFDVTEGNVPRPFGSILGTIYNQASFFDDTLALADVFSSQTDSGNDETLDALVEFAQKQRALQKQTIDADQAPLLTWNSQAMPGGMRMNSGRTTVQPTLNGGASFLGWNIINAGGSVALQDPNGGSLLLPMDTFPSSRTSDRYAKISGGLLVLELPGRLTAIDLFSVRSNPRNEALLWSRGFGDESGLSPVRKVDTTAFGDTNASYAISSGVANVISEFRIGPLLGDRILVLQAGDLLAVDSRSGETIWRNSDAPGTGHLAVDDGRVAVVTSTRMGQSGVAFFDLFDGRRTGAGQWDHGKVWATNGKYVLAYKLDAKSSSATVRLVDPFSDEVVLETDALIKQPLQQTVGRGMGRVLQDRFMVLFDWTGRLLIWDLEKGVELCRHETGEMSELQSMQAMWMDGQLLILPALEFTRSKDDKVTQHGETHRTANKIIAVSTEDGGLRWSREFEQPWGVTLDQPYGSPVILMTRSKTVYTINSNTPKVDVAMVRLSDGQTIHEELGHEVPPQSSGLTTIVMSHPMVNRVTARIDGERLIYEFGGSTAPIVEPEPE